MKKEISERVDFGNRFSKIMDKITSAQFKDNLQGVYGFIDKKIFERNKRLIAELA